MMGQLGGGQDKLFYSFNLDNHIPRTPGMIWASNNAGHGATFQCRLPVIEASANGK
ncbi:hypothetical protein QF002_008418 [Paraburkholderia youngii]